MFPARDAIWISTVEGIRNLIKPSSSGSERRRLFRWWGGVP
jgi:hypothetical protein